MYIDDYNSRKVLNILEAGCETEYYNKLFRENDINIKKCFDINEFRKIPLTTKKDYRMQTLDFVNNRMRAEIEDEKFIIYGKDYKKIDNILYRAGLNLAITSGSTGEPLKVIHSLMDDRRNYLALNIYRKSIGNIDFKDRYIWLVPMNERTKTYFYERETNYICNKNGIDYFLSDYNQNTLAEVHKTIVDNKITWITASPSAIVEYAKFLINNRITYKFKYIELHSEKILSWQEKIIRSVFGNVFVSVYSSNEINFIAATHKCNQMHIIKNNVLVELEKSINNRNKVIVTGLNYIDTPFIRYEIGDLAEIYKCDVCDRSVLELLEYRLTDLIITENGNRFEPYIIFDSIYFLCEKYNVVIDKYTVIQKGKGVFLYYIDIDLYENKLKTLKDFLIKFLVEALNVEDVEIEIYKLDNMKRKYNKYRRFISEVISV